MRRLWQDLQTHWLATTLFLLVWLVLVAITAPTDPVWRFVPHLAVPPGWLFVLYLAAAFTAGLLIGWWRMRAIVEVDLAASVVAGALIGLWIIAVEWAVFAAATALETWRVGGPPAGVGGWMVSWCC